VLAHPRHGRTWSGHPRLTSRHSRKTWMPATSAGMTAERCAPFVTADAARSHPIHLSNSHAKSSAASVGPAGGRRVSALAGRVLVPRKAEGAERRVAPRKLHALAGVRVPLAKGTQRPSALRTALDGLRGRTPFDGAFPALALGVAGIGSDRIAWGRCAPGRIPEPLGPRACKARRRRRRTPLHLRMPPVAPSSEPGCRNITAGI
jgi:hypothetical protein